MTDDETQDAQKEGVAYLYLIFAIITAISLVFIQVAVPETKGMSPEQLNDKSHSVTSPLVDDSITGKL